MLQLKKRTRWLFITTLAVCFVFTLAASLLQSNFGNTKVTTHTWSLARIAEEIAANNSAGNKNIEVSFTPSASAKICFKLLVPKNATPSNPVPAIVAMPGGLANKEHYMQNFVEWSRRGFVVLVFDPMGHGKTDQAVDGFTHNSMGMEAVTEYAMSLPYVNARQVGVTGHSWGNDGSVATISAIRHTNNPKISAFLEGQGSLAVLSLEEGATENLLFGFSVGKYDEMDTVYWNAYTLPTSDWAIGWIKEIYPEFSERSVPLETWFTPKGGQTLGEGTKFAGTEARVLYNPENTHPAGLFSRTAAHVNINFFYGAFGVPNGAKYLSSDNQIWLLVALCTCIAMIAWILLALPVLDLLLQLPLFTALRRKETGEAEVLPAFKTKREAIPSLAMFLVLAAFSGMSLVSLTAQGAKLIPTSPFFASASHQANAFGYWTFIVALVATVVLFVTISIKSYAYRKAGIDYTPPKPFEPANAKIQIVIHSIFLGLVGVAIMYAIVFLVDWIFKVDFRIATVEFTTFRLDKIYTILRYCLLYALFYIVNGVIVANTRFKDIPDWISTGLVVLGNMLGIIGFVIVQYGTLFQKGLLYSPDASATCTVVFSMFAAMIFAPIIARYTYNKTGKIWLGAAFNTLLFTTALVGTGQYMTQAITMFGL